MVTAMPISIERAEVKRLADSGAQIVEVLGPDAFEEEHIRGAINLPLKKLNRASAAVLDNARPVIVYCNDFL
ncbi:MAG: phage shock protein [Actinomycetota bacterium]|jgi:rhodanese-related sulfurtransferase|nr:phage shock protein [Actinomycetota bacterium]